MLTNTSIKIVLLISPLICSSCLKLTITDEEKWIKQEGKNIHKNFEMIYDFNSYGRIYDFVFTKNDWKIYLFKQTLKTEIVPGDELDYYRNYYVDSIHILSPNSINHYGITNHDTTISNNVAMNLYFRNGKIYLINNYFTPLTSPALSIYKIDSTFNSEINLIDSLARDLNLLTADSSNIYYKTSDDSLHCFNFETEMFNNNCWQNIPSIKSATFVWDDPYIYSVDSNKIVKKDINQNEVLTFLSGFEIKSFILENGYIYACGTEGETHSSYSRKYGNYDPYIGKWDMAGNLIWETNFESDPENNIGDIDELKYVWNDVNGNVVSIGTTTAGFIGDEYLYLIVSDQNGTLITEKIFSIKDSKLSNTKDIRINRVDRQGQNFVKVQFNAKTYIGTKDISGIFLAEFEY